MTELENLIERLQRGLSRNASIIKTIRHPQLLVASLRELNELIGNEKVKDSVAKQISYLIMTKHRASRESNIKEDDVMLNTVLYGPPGVGKTLIGTKLAKIWYSLGYLNNFRRERRRELSETVKDMVRNSTTGSTNNTDDDTTVTIVVLVFAIMLFIMIISLAMSAYNKFGGLTTGIGILVMFALVIILAWWLTSSSNSNETVDTSAASRADVAATMNDFADAYMPTDDQIIKVVTRDDFVGQYVGWTSKRTNDLLNANLGKVIFVDEAYSLINGPHDEFGNEALTALNLFLSQHPKEIIVIFAGYQAQLESGPFAVQPGLKRRFMWQFDCNGYTTEQMYQIFKLQLRKKGWDVNNDEEILKLFQENADAFPAYGGDTEKVGFFAKIEHSMESLNDETIPLDKLLSRHVRAGISKLRDNNISKTKPEPTSSPFVNMMRLLSGSSQDKTIKSDDLLRSAMSNMPAYR